MHMRLLRGVGGRTLRCGCLVGVYETYEGEVVTTIDVPSPTCADPQHRRRAVLTSGSAEPDDPALGPTRS